jgi:hypothetical protein
LNQWRFATGLVAAAVALAAAAAAITLATVALAVAVAITAAVASIAVVVVVAVTSIAAVFVAVTAALLLGRVRGVLLVREDLRLIRAFEPRALDGPDVRPHLVSDPLGIVRVIGRHRGRGVDR